MQLAIEYDRNNRPFVVVEEDILEGVPKEEWIDKVKETMAQKFPEGIRVGNNIIRISRKTRKEWTRSKNSSWLRYNDADAYADKMRAAGNADEIIRASGDYVNESINHERKDGIVDFARGRVRLSIGGRDYSASVIIGNNMDNALTLYDIVDMKAEHIAVSYTHLDVYKRQPGGRAGQSGAAADG